VKNDYTNVIQNDEMRIEVQSIDGYAIPANHFIDGLEAANRLFKAMEDLGIRSIKLIDRREDNEG